MSVLNGIGTTSPSAERLDALISRALLVLPQSPPLSSRDVRFHGYDSGIGCRRSSSAHTVTWQAMPLDSVHIDFPSAALEAPPSNGNDYVYLKADRPERKRSERT